MYKRINQNDKDFYIYLGSIFGSRKIERETKDRFYDDPDKEWIIHINKCKIIDSVISLDRHGILKNIYSENEISTVYSLKSIYNEVVTGVLPSLYADLYKKSGYQVEPTHKNFVKVRGGKNDETGKTDK